MNVEERGITEHSNYACGCAECTELRARLGGGRAFGIATGRYEWLSEDYKSTWDIVSMPVESDPSTDR